MGPPVSNWSMPVWLGGRRRDCVAGSYVLKVMSMAMICILLGYSVSKLVPEPAAPAYAPSQAVESLRKTSGGSEGDIFGTGSNSGASASPHGHEPTLYKPQAQAEQGTRDDKDSLYEKFTDRIKTFNPWQPADGESGQTRAPALHEIVGASEDDLHEGQVDELAQKEPLNKTGSYETILAYKDVTVDSAPLIGKVTIVFGEERPIYDRAVRTHEFHNRLHGYPMHVLRQSILNDVWSKPAYILSVMLREMAKPRQDRLKWLFWADADTIITNPMVPLEIFLPPSDFEDIDVLVTQDWNGLNNGVFLMRINERAINLFSRIITFPYYRPDVQLNFRDQSAMANLLKTPEIESHVMWVPQRWFNAYQGELDETIGPHQIRHGDFLLHFAGVINRDERMGHWLQRAELHSDEWEVQLRFTSYPREIEEFWNGERAKKKEKTKVVDAYREKCLKFFLTSKNNAERYKAKFSNEEWQKMEGAFMMFKAIFQHDRDGYDFQKLKRAFERLQEALLPLQQTSQEANRILLKDTHDLLFSAEKLMLDEESEGERGLEVQRVEFWIQKVKDDLLQSPLDSDKTGHDATELRKKFDALSKKVQEDKYDDHGTQKAGSRLGSPNKGQWEPVDSITDDSRQIDSEQASSQDDEKEEEDEDEDEEGELIRVPVNIRDGHLY